MPQRERGRKGRGSCAKVQELTRQTVRDQSNYHSGRARPNVRRSVNKTSLSWLGILLTMSFENVEGFGREQSAWRGKMTYLDGCDLVKIMGDMPRLPSRLLTALVLINSVLHSAQILGLLQNAVSNPQAVCRRAQVTRRIKSLR
jgi:hypothetical protein